MTGSVAGMGAPSAVTGTRLVMVGAFIGAIAVLAVTTMFSWQPGTQRQPPVPSFNAPVGACLTWQRQDASDMHTVDCTKPHMFQVTGKVELPEATGPLPDTDRWRQIAQQRCTAPAERFLGKPVDPHGKYSVGALKPNAEQWRAGDRTLRCGLQVSGVTGTLLPATGSAKGADQSAVYPQGTCLGFAGKSVGDPVPCGERHSYEIVGVVNLAAKLGAKFPSAHKQQQELLDACTAALHAYAKGVNLHKYGLTLTWDTRDKASWQDGSTSVNCKVGAPLKDKSGLKPITGSIKR